MSNEITFGDFLFLCFIGIILFFSGAMLAWSVQEDKIRQEIIDAKHGEYFLDENNEKAFRFLPMNSSYEGFTVRCEGNHSGIHEGEVLTHKVVR